MLILGAGLNGCLAAMKFKEARILEYLPNPSVHKAVLRFRTEDVSQLLGIPFKKVQVQKGIVINGEFVQPSIRNSNWYAKKVTGMAASRSIDNLEPSIRFIAPDDLHIQLLARLHKRIEVNVNYVPHKRDEPVISTVPLPVLCEKLGLDNPISTERLAKPVHVRTIKFARAELYQTIYYPAIGFPVYRASMTGNTMIIEATSQITSRDCMKVINDFGLESMEHTFGDDVIQQYGKFVPLDDIYRKRLMLKLTAEYGVYSLGRHATWRKLLLDDTPKDLEVIERLIKVDEYDLRIGRK